MHVYVCVYVYVCVHVYVYVYVCIHIHTLHTHTHTYVHMYVYAHIVPAVYDVTFAYRPGPEPSVMGMLNAVPCEIDCIFRCVYYSKLRM